MTEYVINKGLIANKNILKDASKEELCVLLILVSLDGRISGAEELSELCGTSKARVASALVLWEEMGVIAPKKADGNVTDEHAHREGASELYEESSEKIAKDIHDHGLASLLSECAILMGKPTLTGAETNKIVSVYTQYSLGEEYIITLAAYLKEKGKLSATRLATEAERLIKIGIDCVEELEKYIAEKENETDVDMEFKHLLGIRNRNLSAKEREYAEKWFSDFGFSVEIIGLAYSYSTVNTDSRALPYMDKLLCGWHEAGCRTAAECEAHYNTHKAEIYSEGSSAPKSKKKTKEKPRYGEFDINDAFAKALERSYGED